MLKCELSASADTSLPLSLRQTVTSRAALRIDRVPLSLRNQSLAEGGNMAPVLRARLASVSKIKFRFVFQAHRCFFSFFSCPLFALRWGAVCFGEGGRERFRFDDSMSLSSPASANSR